MEINRDNYEAYLLDLLEGRLSAEDQQELKAFLLSNPDCSAEPVEIKHWVLKTEKISFPGTGRLKKEIPTPSTTLEEHNFDLFSIARMEGDLTAEQVEAHRSMVVRDERRSRQWAEWQKTRLEARPLIFQGKDQLKHSNRNRSGIIWLSLVSAAAAVTLLVMLMRTGTGIPGQELSQQSTTTAQKQILNGEKDQPAETPDDRSLERAEAQTGFEAPQEDNSNRPETLQELNDTGTSALVAVTRDQNLPDESEMKQLSGPHDDLRPHPLKVAENTFNVTSPVASGPVYDQIGSMHIEPVPIHLSSLSVGEISEMDLPEIVKEYTEEKNLSLWNIASAGINGINKIAGSDISLMASRDEDGEISGFKLKSRRFSLTRPVGQE